MDRVKRGSAPKRANPAHKRGNAARVPTAIVALDVPSAADAVQLVERLGPACRFYKVGNELFTASGPAIVDYLRARGAEVFLDLKFHDIPTTVGRAAAAAAATGVRLVTVHAAGGPEMVRAAVDGASEGASRNGSRCGVLAVTVLTSLDARRLGLAWGRRIASVEKEVLRLAAVALKGRADGVVCSGAELETVRAKFADRLAILVPGIRPAGARRGDQARVVTPQVAARGGADYVVLGRVVTRAPDPSLALAGMLADLAEGIEAVEAPTRR